MKPNPVFGAILAALIFLSSSEAFSQTVTRGAYLQMGNETSIIIRWRTSTATNSRVRIGTSYLSDGLYSTIVDSTASTKTEHTVRVTGLSADTKYFYSVGTTTGVLQVDAANFFTTAPPANTTRTIRIAAFGDCGREGTTGTTNQTNSYNAYQTFLTDSSIDAADAWILLGDNAYDLGTDTEYGTNFFAPYSGGTKKILRNHKLYPSPGNHEYDYSQTTAKRILRTWPYFSLFNFPQNGECGGVASTKPNFYSFDIGNIHFLSLDSHGMEPTDANSWMGTNSASTIMKNWIAADLAANTKKWVIAYWHHPPYSKGSHNSDNTTSDQQMIDVRTNFIRFLEVRGVDMVICGHSHAYERSYLMKNYSGSWASFSTATHAVNTNSAKYTGTAASAPHKYNSTPLDHGTVYVVAGNTGAVNSSTTGFASGPMPWATTTAGVFYLEVEENKLRGRMLRHTGAFFDTVTVFKDVNKSNTINIVIGQSATLNASWPGAGGTYQFRQSPSSTVIGTNRSLTVTPGTTGTFTYTVADNNNGGLLDNFTVNVSAVLPVDFTSFTAQRNNAGVNIRWSVATASNHAFFGVERSSDGVNFSEIHRNTESLDGVNSKSFEINDNNLPSAAVLYYRIRQCDANGVCKYTEVRVVRFSTKNVLTVYPVPAQNTLNTDYVSLNNAKVTLNIVNETGTVVSREGRSVSQGRNNLQMDISWLKPGHYIITLNDGTEKWTERFIKL
jgi:acid phosphatase type 7